ncbi:glutathione S-transferase N-terminal domain-containing protein [Prosthecodimorpha staleyi]|uniref:Glutathione S-transferase N-terminal domain-containing protein n=1 Tax=Prosthecodimorpha staleyi TaxID=2840188 RepID=A0A947D397_9HYPH|nr:glutathione S-transferase N-terminal domain-containing protein [Prosthecodimorpha staleyi]MBT9290188.1 glutathione S-transferase N-terminal domain-containing protein [Prosthecodimorpha staleyi]
MRLLWSPRSPFVRKVMILVHELGLQDRIECVRAVAVPRGAPNPVIAAENPLGKIPVLLRDSLPPLYDSRVIAEALIALVPDGEKILPASGEARLTQLRWQALGDGLTDNLLLWRIERMGVSGGDPGTMASYRAKVVATLAALEGQAAALAAAPFGLGQIAILCALGQLDFRYRASGWRPAHPHLAAWAETQATRPSLVATAVQDDIGSDEGPVMDLVFGGG